MIPMTHFAEYLATAKVIQRAVGESGPAAADLRQVVADLAALAVKALEEAHQTFEGLAALLMAMHPEVTRRR
jgi:cation transport regulator ChaC